MRQPPPSATQLAVALMLLLGSPDARGQDKPGEVLDQQKISASNGGFTGEIGGFYEFGHSLARIGDLDGDGVADLAVGSDEWSFISGGVSSLPGSVWILFLQTDGTVREHVQISDGMGGFDGDLDPDDRFGSSIAYLGDVNGDGNGDIAVGAIRDDDGNFRSGAVWILFMKANGTVRSQAKISNTSGGFVDTLGTGDEFGNALAGLGDFDGDGVPDLVVGAHERPPHNTRGSYWVVLLEADGSVKSATRTDAINPPLATNNLATSLASLGDFDGDGIGDIAAVSAQGVWIIRLQPDGTIKSTNLITAPDIGVGDVFAFFGPFGADGIQGSVASLGDLDGDGIGDIALGTPYLGAGGVEQVGSVYILMLNADGTVKQTQPIRNGAGNFGGTISQNGHFGWSLAALGDLDGDGVQDLAVGEHRGDDGAANAGHVWMLFLEAATWIDLGQALPGTSGTPRLEGLGSLQRDESVNIALTDARPSSLAFLVVGFSELNASFKGGVLVPDPAPPGTLFALPTSGAGEIVIDETWPPGVPPDFTTIFQYWVQDPGAVADFSASNALAATTP